MSIRPIIQLGNPILRQPSHTVEKGELRTPTFTAMVRDMIETMHHANGIGLAAPQIGINKNVAIINGAHGAFAIINPRIARASFRKETDEEGCLSIPEVFGLVRRSRSIVVTYLDMDGTTKKERVPGLMARVFQHEIDHLHGILFIDRMTRLTRGTVT